MKHVQKGIVAWGILLSLCIGMLSPLSAYAAGTATADTAALGQLADSYTAQSGSYTLTTSSRFFIVADAAPTGELLQTVQLAQQQFAADGKPSSSTLTIVWGPETHAQTGDIIVKLDSASKLIADGYRLEVNGTARVTASDTDGLLYGLNALLKHLRAADGASLSAFTQQDEPDTVDRVVSLDCGRKYYTKNWICNFIREMSWMGYNTLELHFSDDAGFRMDFWDPAYYTDTYQPANDFSWICGSHYTSWTDSDYRNDPDKDKYLTTAEVVEILQTAAEYHIDVIPAFDSPSHFDYLTWKYEQNYKSDNSYSFYSTYYGSTYYANNVNGCINYTGVTGYSAPQWPYYTTINVINAQSKAFTFELYTDIAKFFKEYAGSTDFSIGADEVNLSSSYGVKWGYSDFVTYINNLNTLLNSMGYTMRMFNDFIGSTTYNGSSYNYASNIEIMYWDSPFDPNDGSGTTATNTQPVSYYINNGRTLYNCIQTNTYYVLRVASTNDKYNGMDARSSSNYNWHFTHSNEEDIYNEWYPADISEHGQTSEDVADVPADLLGGAYFLIWCDYACVNTEQEIWNGVTDPTGKSTEFFSLRDRMWSNITKMWNWDVNSTLTFAAFETIRDGLGDFPGLGSGTGACSAATVLPEATAAVCPHDYSAQTVQQRTCTQDGITKYTCSICGHSYQETDAAGHDYTATPINPTCVSLRQVSYSCISCGDTYTGEPEWMDKKPADADDALLETRTLYRYSDYKTTTSYNTSLENYTQAGSSWQQSGTGSVEYVTSWPTGFDTSSSAYATYNKQSSKVTASETETTKTVINSDAITGYLYYHWCYSNSYYSAPYKHNSYSTFHAYYSTVAPSNYACDTSDYSYRTSNNCCSNSNWFFVRPVYTQKYTTYKKLYTYERWTDWSDWSETPCTASDTRKVETKTQYRYVSGTLGDHDWKDGVCTVCKTPCTHIWEDGVCSTCKLVCPHASHSTDGKCTVCGTACTHQYEDAVTAPTCTTDGFTTHTCSICKTSYTDSTVTATGHTWTDKNGSATGKCIICGTDCEHPAHDANGICTVCGSTVAHDNVNGSCTGCSAVQAAQLTNYAKSLLFEDIIHVRYYFELGGSYTEDYLRENGGILVWTSAQEQYTPGTEDQKIEGLVPSTSTYVYATGAGIPAKQWGDTLYACAYLKNPDGTYSYSGISAYSPLQYAANMLGKEDVSENLKALLVAMLNYGSAAQINFQYNTGLPMNSILTASQQAWTWDENQLKERVEIDPDKIGVTQDENISFFAWSLIHEGAIGMRMYNAIPAQLLENAQETGLIYWNEATYNSAQVLTPENAAGKVVGLTCYQDSYYHGTITGVAAKNLGDTYFACAYLIDAEGVTHYGEVRAYSAHTYAKNQINANKTAELTNLCKTMVLYSNAAKTYFANRG